MEYFNRSRWFIRIRPARLKIDRLESEIYEETGDSYDTPEPFVVANFMYMNCSYPHSKYMLVVF